MERVFGLFVATGWFTLISALWLGGICLAAVSLLQRMFTFNPLQPASWRLLYQGFQSGQSIPLSFFLICLSLAILAAIGEMALLLRLPAIISRLPSLSLPHFFFRLPGWPPRKARAPANTEPGFTAKPTPISVPSPAPEPPPAVEEPATSNDSAILARILALFEVWNEPPPSWMAEALRDEIHLLSPGAWPTLESLGGQGLELLATLQEHGMLPESQIALKAIGEVETALRTGLAAEAAIETAAPPLPILTLGASWLCEALENYLALRETPRPPQDQLAMARTMLDRAMRGMKEEDWASLDQFPEKAGRVRVLTDQLREDLRQAPAPAPVPEAKPSRTPADPIATTLSLLERFGFVPEAGGLKWDGAPLLAQRPDLLLLLHLFDLGQKSWRMPQGLLGSWLSQSSEAIQPGRQLWQFLARRRLRHADPRPLAGLIILHGGKVEQEELLADLVAADRRRSHIGLAWLDDRSRSLPSLERELRDLTERAARDRSKAHSNDYSTAQS